MSTLDKNPQKASQEEAEKIYHIVKHYVDRMDYCALLERGCPSDEFDSESIEIAKKIRKGSSFLTIRRVLTNVFNTAFSEDDPPELFSDVAQMIKDAIDRL